MTTYELDFDGRDSTYEAAFDELWQQTCLGRFSVAQMKERLLALQDRFRAPAAAPQFIGPQRQALG
jgi:hypothetical protein